MVAVVEQEVEHCYLMRMELLTKVWTVEAAGGNNPSQAQELIHQALEVQEQMEGIRGVVIGVH